MERRDVAGHQGSDESAYKCHSEDAHVHLRQLVSKGSAQMLRSVMPPPAESVPIGLSRGEVGGTCRLGYPEGRA